MDNSNYLPLIQKAFQKGYISPKQVQPCLDLLAKELPPGISAETFLIQKGILTFQQIQEIAVDPATQATRPEQVAVENLTATKKMLRVGGLLPGVKVGPFTILGLLGQGGMGAVYLAEQDFPQRKVALKMLTKLHAKDKIAMQRLLKEAELTAQLDHPNIVKAYMSGILDDIPYLAIAYINGQRLDNYIKQKTLSLPEKLKLMRIVTEALHYAHQKGIIHRDLKPSNIMITQEGEPIIMDFGIAKSLRSHKSLTKTGETVGTPQYMSPEQAAGEKDLDERSDIYSVGIILYELLTNVSPYSGQTDVEIMYQIVSLLPIMPRQINSDIPPEVEAIVLKCLEKDKRRRYSNALELSSDIRKYLEGSAKVQKGYQLTKVRWHILSHRKTILYGILVFLALFLGYLGSRIWISKESKIETKNREKFFLLTDESMEGDIVRNLEKEKSLENYLFYIKFLQNSGYYMPAIQECDKAIDWLSVNKREKEIPVVEREKASLLLKSGHYAKSYELYEKVGQNHTFPEAEYTKLRLEQAEAAFGYNNTTDCAKILQTIEEKSLVSLSQSQQASYFFYFGASLLKNFLFSIGRQHYLNKVPKPQPSHFQIDGENPENSELDKKDLEDLKKAILFLEKAKETLSLPSELQTRILLYCGYAYLWNSQWEESEKQLTGIKSDNLFSVNESMLLQECLGLLAYCKEEYQQATAYFGKCIERMPWEKFYYFYRTQTNIKHRMQAGAKDKESMGKQVLDDCFKALDLFPDDLAPFGFVLEDIIYNQKHEDIMESIFLMIVCIKRLGLREEPNLWKSEYRTLANNLLSELSIASIESSVSEKGIRTLIRRMMDTESEEAFRLAEKIILGIWHHKDVISQLESAMEDASLKKKKQAISRIDRVRKSIEAKKKEFRRIQIKGHLARFISGKDTTVLSQLTKDDYLVLQNILNDKSESIFLRYSTAQMLLGLRVPETYQMVVEASKSTDPELQILARCTLLGGGFSAELSTPNDWKGIHPHAAALLVHHIRKRAPADVCKSFMKSTDNKLKIAAAVALLHQGDPESIPIVMESLDSVDEDVKVYCYWFLWTPSLFEIVKSLPNPQQNEFKKDLVRRLEYSITKETNPMVRSSAIASLDRLFRLEWQYQYKEKLELLEVNLDSRLKNLLEQQLEKEADASVRYQILTTLISMNGLDTAIKWAYRRSEIMPNRIMPFLRMSAREPYLNPLAGKKTAGIDTASMVLKIFQEILKSTSWKTLDVKMKCLYLVSVGFMTKSRETEILKYSFVTAPIMDAMKSPITNIRRMASYAALANSEEASLRRLLKEHFPKEKDKEVKSNILSTFTYFRSYEIESDPAQATKNDQHSWIMRFEQQYPKAFAYGNYHFIETSYNSDIDDRKIDYTTLWGRDHRYMVHLDSIISRICYESNIYTNFPNSKGYLLPAVELVLKHNEDINICWMANKISQICKKEEATTSEKFMIRRFMTEISIIRLAQYLENARKLNPKSRYHFELSFFYECLGEYEKAYGALQKAIHEEPDRIIYHAAKARIFFKMGHLEDASQEISNLEKKMNQANIGDFLVGLQGRIALEQGKIAFQNGDSVTAIRKWEKAEKHFTHQHIIQPYKPDPFVWRAHVYLWQAQKTGQPQWLRKAENDLQMAAERIEQEKKRADSLYENDSRCQYYPYTYANNARALSLFEYARLYAQNKNFSKSEECCEEGMALFEDWFAKYGDSPFSRSYFAMFPELQNMTGAMKKMPKKIVAFVGME